MTDIDFILFFTTLKCEHYEGNTLLHRCNFVNLLYVLHTHVLHSFIIYTETHNRRIA